MSTRRQISIPFLVLFLGAASGCPHDALPPLPPADEPALVAVSGGRDSVALLHMLVERGFSRLTVLHLDHALRAESRADAKFVRALAKKLGVAFVSKRMDVAAMAARSMCFPRRTRRSCASTSSG